MASTKKAPFGSMPLGMYAELSAFTLADAAAAPALLYADWAHPNGRIAPR